MSRVGYSVVAPVILTVAMWPDSISSETWTFPRRLVPTPEKVPSLRSTPPVLVAGAADTAVDVRTVSVEVRDGSVGPIVGRLATTIGELDTGCGATGLAGTPTALEVLVPAVEASVGADAGS